MNILQYSSDIEGSGEVNTFVAGSHSDLPFNAVGNLLKVMQMNIRSINKNLDNFLVLLESLNQNFDIIILTESWNIANTSQYNINGYSTFYSRGEYNQNDGVVVFVKDEVDCTFDTIKYSDNTFCILNFEKNDISFCVICVYRLPSTDASQFVNDFQNLIKLTDKNKVCLFAGDMNIDVLDLNDNCTNHYLNVMAQNGFLSCVNEPTRVTSTSQTCIDHMFVRRPSKIHNLDLIPVIVQSDVTDHYAVVLQFRQSDAMYKKNINPPNPQYSNILDYTKLKNYLLSESWDGLYTQSNPNVAYDNFIQKLQCHIGSSKKMIKIKSVYKKIKPWITDGLVKSIRTRDKLKVSVLKNKDNLELFQRYKNYRNILNTLLKKTKALYFSRKIREHKGDSKKTWQIINEGLNKQKKRNNKITLNVNGKILQNSKEIAEILNDHFINVGKNMITNINKQKLIPDQNIDCSSLFLAPVTELELLNNIKKLKVNSAPGEDTITATLIKEIRDLISKPLTFIFNLSFECGIYPDALKRSIVTPVFKSGSQSDPNNYRPISVINNFGKVFEMSIKKRLNDHLKHNKVISDLQFGFREGVGTEDAIYHVTKFVYNSLDKNKKPLAIFIDLAKAFDTVSHDLLLEKLHSYGVRGVANDFFCAYLTGRQQRVKVNNELSDSRVVTCGVPQGTVLGPILFSVYMNELLNLKVKAKIISYADDTVLLCEGDNWEEVRVTSTVVFATIQQWLDQNLLTLNLSKTKFMCYSIYDLHLPDFQEMHIHSYQCLLDNKVNCQCINSILATNSIKYLGIIMDKNLKWCEHIDQLNKKLRKLISYFYKLRDIFPLQILKTVYLALAESILRYGICFWGGAFPTNLEILNVTQHFLLKILLRKHRRFSSEMLYKELEVFDINQLFIRSALIFTYKKHDLKQLVVSNYNTRNRSNKLVQIPLATKTTTQRFLTYYGPKLYNILPLEIRTINSIKLFNKKVTRYLFDNPNQFLRVLQSRW